jgi:hypothetical protein
MERRNMVMQVSLSFYFNAKENIQQNIYTSKCVINLILALNPDAYFGTEKLLGGKNMTKSSNYNWILGK